MRRLAFGIALVWLSASCGHVTREQMLYQQANAFHNDVKWKRYSEATNRVVPWRRLDFLDKYGKTSETLQIEDYELQAVLFPAPGEAGYAKEATMATFKMFRYQVESPSVTRDKIDLLERWLYNGDGWFVFDGY
jgi:hypothetical protein